jgi:hypothetical protein
MVQGRIRGGNLVKEIKVYVEGGGNTSKTQEQLRVGFNGFFRELKQLASANDCKLNFIPCGGNTETFRDFEIALKSRNDAIKVLLVDSDGPVTQQPKKHLKIKNPDVMDEQYHLMVQIMESWFIADINALYEFYKEELDEECLTVFEDVEDVENIDRKEIEMALRNATKGTSYGDYCEYGKIRHASEILKKLNANTVRRKAAHCDRLFTTLESLIASM